jgi:hypothetical protein
MPFNILVAQVGMLITGKHLRSSICSCCELNGIVINSFSQNSVLAGREWMKLFVIWHPDMSKKENSANKPRKSNKIRLCCLGRLL